MPGARDRFECVLDRSLTNELRFLARRDRVPTFTEKLARLFASPTCRSDVTSGWTPSAGRFSVGPKRYFSL